MSSAAVLERESIRNMVVRLSVKDYHWLSASGVIPEKTELIEGIVLNKMTKSPLHAHLLRRLWEFFSNKLPAEHLLLKEDPLTLERSEPEPDIAVVKGRVEDFKTTHPNRAELIIEVAVSSLELDREKACIYAEAGIPEYWIVLPEQKKVEVYREPVGENYRRIIRYDESDSLTCLGLSIAVKDIFG